MKITDKTFTDVRFTSLPAKNI